MSYDPGHGQAVLFGGTSGAIFLNDTWLWNGTAWTLANPALSPSIRSAFAMTYDAAHGNVVLFGGRPAASGAMSDTWLWNGTIWTQATPGTIPPARSNNAMVYDAARGNVVMFGGLVGGLGANDTWIWNGSNWIQMFPAASPTPRSDYGMAYDAVHHNVVLFGGSDQFGNNLNDTWIWNGTTWTQMSPGTSPTPRYGQRMTWDDALGQVVLFGGTDNVSYFGDTWSWNGASWIQRTGSSSPVQREALAMAYDAAQSQVLIFGGYNGGFLGDTWEWSTPQNFGNVSVCPSGPVSGLTCTTTVALTYSVPVTTSFGATTVTVQGTSVSDFSLVNSTCTGTVSALKLCNATITFAPQAPGLRVGAVNLFDSGNNLLVSTPIYGTGLAAQTAFTPATQTTILGMGTLNGPGGVAVDAAGDVFVADTNNARVLEIAANSTQTSIGFGLNKPQAVALDGVGDLFIADNNASGNLIEIPYGCTTATCQKSIATGLQSIVGVAVDGLGDFFVSDSTDGEVEEMPANGASPAIVYSQPGSAPRGLAVDSAGDLFIAAYGFGKVIEIPAGCTNSACNVAIGIGWSLPEAVAVDAAGDVYVADQGLSQIVEVPAGCTTGVCQMNAAGGFPSMGVALDGQGNIYYTDTSAGKLDKALVGANALALGFGAQTTGSQSAPKSFTLQNIGSQTLSAISPGLQIVGGDFVQVNASSPGNCTSSFSLTPGAVCNTSIAFYPLTPGSYSEFVNFTDNSLNGTPATQSINLVGNGVAPTYTLTVTPMGAGAGTVTSSDGFINCSIANGSVTGTCSKSYSSPPSGLTVTSAAAPGSTFQAWGGSTCSGVYPICSVNLGSATTITATFNPIYFAVTAPTTPVNTISAVGTATVNFTGSGTLGAISVVTQGAAGKDFNIATGSTCAIGTAYTLSQTCTVNYTFTPLAPGARNGAVVLTDSSGNVLGTTYLSGIGTGPRGLFDTTPQTLSITGLQSERGISVDGSGNIYAVETRNNGAALEEFPAGTSTKIQIAGSPVVFTGGTAVDGAGNVWMVTNSGTLYELVGGKTPLVLVASGIPTSDNNLVVDGAGNLYYTGCCNNNPGAVYEIPAGTTQAIQLISTSTAPTGRRFVGMSIDAAGNLIAPDFNGNVIYEIPAGTSNLVPLAITAAAGFSNPHGVAVDPAGAIYVTYATFPSGTASVIRYTPGAGGTYTSTVLPEIGQKGIAFDSAGNMYTIADDATIAGYTRTQASPITFASTPVGTISNSLQGDLFENGGNALLSITGYSATVPFAPGGPLNTCATGVLASGASCVVGATFTPTAAVTVGGTATVADNNLGLSATQTIALSGTGIAATYTLTVTPIGSGSGTVTDNLTTISCTTLNGNYSGTCAASYATVTSVTLTATPSAGSIFLGWGGGACTGFAPTCQVSVGGLLTVTASFTQQNFGTPNVCPPGQTTPAPCSTSIPVTINVPITTNIGAIQVVTQGVTGLDFSLANAGTCTGTVTGGTACTVNVNFAPLAPGSRLGAVKLYDTGGNLVVTVPIYGIGQGPAAAFSPSKAIPINTGTLDYPAGLLVDAVGNLFIAEGDVTNQVLKITPNGSISTIGSGMSLPQGMAEDGAGDLFVANNNLNEVIEFPAGCTSSTCQVVLASNLVAQLGVAVDGAGDLFVGEFTKGQVVEIPAGCTTSSCQQVIYSATGSTPVGVTADAAGNVFFADEAHAQIIEVPAGCSVANCWKFIGVGWAQPDGVAVDAAGNVYVADQKLQEVVEVPNGCSASGCQIVLASGIRAVAVTVDSSGNLVVDNITTNQVLEIPRSLTPSLNFALTSVGSTSTDSPQSVSIQNVGNQTLTGGLSVQNSQDFVNFQQTATCNQFNLAPGAVCTQAFSFAPTTTGVLTDTRTFSDNSMNIAASVSLQPVNLSGIANLNGATGTVVPNVVGMTASAAATALTSSGLTVGSVSNGYSSSEPAGSVSGESPAAGSPVNLGSAVNLMIAIGQAPAPVANPLKLENNYFVTGDFASAGVTLKGAPANNGVSAGTITIPDLTSCNCSQGVPDGADIVDGFLYWTTIESPGSTPTGNTGTFLGYPIVGQQVGVDVPNYSDGTTTGTLRVYRADVNGYFQVQPGWNGERLGSGPFAITLPNGSATQGGFPVTEGASLVVIYRVLSLSVPLKSVVIYDGAAVPAGSATQTVQGFYDALGGNGELTTLSAAGGSWNNSLSSVSLTAHGSQYTATLNPNTAYAAVVFSTPVTNSDNDGILDAWKAGPGAPDFFAGQPGYYDVKTQSWVALPGAKHGQKDLFVQFDWMCGSVDGNGNCTGENLFPSPDVNGNDPLAMVQQAFKNAGVTLHLEPGNPVAESTCTDSPSQGATLCQFPNQPGVVEWKNGLEFSKLWPRNYNSCLSGGDCTARFPYGQKDSYHYVLFGHSLAIPAWNTRFGTLTAISADPIAGTTTITTADRGPAQLADGSASPLYCSSRFTITGVQGLPSLNGVFAASCPNSTTIILTTPSLGTKSAWTYPNGNLPEPDIGLTSGTVTSISGYSDLGGADSAVTLALWETDPQQDMSKRAQVIAGTMLHEIGHTLGLSHGGIYYQSGSGGFVQNGNAVPLGSYIPNFDINCKPNYQSSMNYLFQLAGVGPNAAVTFSNQTLQTLTGPSLGSVTNLQDVNNALATYPGSSWYSSSQPPNSSETQASRHCDGTPLNAGETGYFVEGSVAPVTPAWTANQNITFDGVPAGSTGLPGLVGYNDQANMDLRQVGATGGEFASLSNVLSFGSSPTPLSILSGGTATLGAGGTVTLGAGGSVTMVNGGSITVGSGAVISGGGAIQFGTAGSVTVTTNSTVTPGANGTITFASGDIVTLTSAGTFTFPSGGTVTLGGGGAVTLGGGGTITTSLGTVKIPSTGGSYDLTSGGTVTLGGGGTVTLGGGGTATLGGGGTATLGGGGAVTLGGGGTATLGAGGAVTLGGGGTATLGGGGTVTLGGGGTVTLGGGGTATLGGGGTVTLGGGGAVTLGGGGTATLGAGGTATLGAGGTATLGAGGTVTVGAGGSITMPGGGTVTLGGGGTVTLGGGGTVTLGGGGTSPITVNGVFFGTCSGSCNVPAGGTVTLGGGGTVTLGGGGTVTLGGGGTVTLGGGGTVTLGGGGVVTLGGGGAVTLGGGGTATLGGGGTATLGGGGTATLGGGGNLATELDYATADSVARPPSQPTYSQLGNSIQVNWTAPIFGVVLTYTISREVVDPITSTVIQAPQVIGSVTGVGGAAPATTFTDTNPPTSGKVIYTITTTLAPDPANPTQLQSAASAPAVLTVGQTIVLGPLPSSVVLGSTQPTTMTVTATAEAGGKADMQQVSFSASGPCSAGSPTIDVNGISSATVTLASTGSCTITASQPGDSTTATTPPAYSAATPVSGTFSILPQGSNQKSQTINFLPLPSVQYGSGFSVTASSSAGQPVSLSANGPCALTTTSSPAGGTTSAAGLCRITATAAAGNGYTGASLTQSFNITAAPLTVTANSFTIAYGQALPSLTYAFGPLVNGDSLSTAVSGTPSLATTAAPFSSPGAYPITVSPGTLTAANYAFDLIGGTLTISPATTATSVVSSSPGNASNFMQQVTFTATVVDSSPGSLGAAPTGTVSFYSNGGLIGTGTLAALPCTTPPCASQAMVSTTTLATGSNNVTVSYSGDAGTNGDGLGNYYASGQGGSTASGLTQTVTPVAIVSLSPASLAFGNINVGKTSSAPVTLTNTGDANLILSSIQVTGPNMGDFTATSACGSSVGYTSGSNSCKITVTFTPSQTGVESATLQITDNADNTPGSQQFVSLTGSGLSTIGGTSVYTDAIFSNSNGCGAITVGGKSSVNSFNSALGYSSSAQNSGGNVGTNGNVTVGGGSTIYGSAATDILTTGTCSARSVTGLATSGGGSVTGGLVALNGPVNYPAPSAPNPAPPTTSQTISGSCPSGMSGCSNTGSKAVTLAPGRYGNVTANSGTTVHVSAGTYFFNSLKITANSLLHVDSGPVIVNLAGASLTGGTPVLDFTGGGMENPGGIPGNLQFTYGGSQGLNLAGGANAYAAVYAPNAPVNLNAGTDFFGSITGSTVTSSGGTSIHYDTNLPNIAQGSTIWFAAVVNNLKGLPANQQVKLYMTNGSISFTANNTQYTVPVPNAVVTLNSSISGSKSTTYDLANSRWSTSIASTNLTGNTFVSGVAFPVPVAFPAGIQNVTWSAAFSTDTPGITLQWQWNAQVFTQFSQTYATTTNTNVLGVNAEDGAADAYGIDAAGTPETYKPNATFGATDGYFSAASGVVPTVAQVSASPSSLSFGTVPVGQSSSPMTAVLTNNYGSGFTISGIAVSGTNASDFTESDNCPRTSGGFTSSCTINVTFKPGYTTPEAARIVITDTANNSPQTVYLSGTGQ
ncbi:MAG TPA: choice-of-anchor D domain-containing protein [Acidobacteriaceae bacterium]|nr:choice-of-anchor D domain-containing protein [Acidobacteriaceae bacterium]